MKGFVIYIPDLGTFRSRVPAQWMPNDGQVRKTRYDSKIKVSHNELRVPA